MTIAAENSPSVSTPARGPQPVRAKGALPLPPTTLELLATRFRQGGLLFAVALPDGTITYHDGQATSFFSKFALPLVEHSIAKIIPSSAAAADGISITQ